MLASGPRQRNVRRHLAAARHRPPAQGALIVTVMVVGCAGLVGGQARAAGPGPGAAPRADSCVSPTAGSLTISPNVIGQAQLPVTFTTSDAYYPPRGAYYDAYTLDCSPVSIGTTPSGGTNYVTFVGSSNLSCGPHVFDDKYYAGGSTPDQEFAGTFTVSCVSANPSTIISTQQPIPITVTGSTFFQDYNSFTVDIDATPVSTTPTFSGNTFTTVITAQGLSCATHTITVSEKLGGSIPTTATTPLVVQCPQGGGTPPPNTPSTPAQPPRRAGAPKLTVNPAVIADGTLTHVTGTGFNPGVPVTLTWQSPAGTKLFACSADTLTTPPPAADASGKIDVYCLAQPHEALGAEQIVADQTANAQLSARHAAAPVVVEDGSMQPSNGDDQLIFRR